MVNKRGKIKSFKELYYNILTVFRITTIITYEHFGTKTNYNLTFMFIIIIGKPIDMRWLILKSNGNYYVFLYIFILSDAI